MKKKFSGLLLVTALVLSACGTGKNADSAKDEKREVKQEINVVSTGELSTLDSALYSDVNSSDMIGQGMEGLYRLNKDGLR